MYDTNKPEWTKVFFSDETTIYRENPGEYKWVHKDKQNIYEVKRGRGKKLNKYGVIFYRRKISIEIFENNLNANRYRQIL